MAGEDNLVGVMDPESEVSLTGGVDRPRIDDALYQQAPTPGPADYVPGADGMPVPAVPTAMPFAPPLAVDTLVCMADESKYVIRGAFGYVLAEFPPDLVDVRPDLSRVVGPSTMLRAVMDCPAPQRAELLQLILGPVRGYLAGWQSLLLGTSSLEDWLWKHGPFQVEPLRPACLHYVRQMTDFQDADTSIFVERLCTARKTSDGVYLSMRDSQIHGCTMREPRDQRTEQRIECFDMRKIELGQQRIARGQTFDVDAALRGAEDPNQPDYHGGIFQ
jgi:hypothetical protein